MTPIRLKSLFWPLLCLLLLWGGKAHSQIKAVDADGKPLSVATCLEKAAEQEGYGNYRQASWFMNQAAMMRWEEKQYDEALGYFQKSVGLNERVNNEHGIVGIYSNMAMIYADKKAYEEALRYFLLTLEGRKKGTDKVSVISAHINTAVVLNNLKRHSEAAQHLEKALDLAREINDPQQMRSCYGMLSETYEKAGNTEQSIHYFNLYRTFHEMVQRDREKVYTEQAREAQLQAQLLEAEKKVQDAELAFKQQELYRKQHELDKAQQVLSKFDSTSRKLYESMDKVQILDKLYAVLKAQQEEDREMHDLKLQRQRYIQYLLIGAVLAVLAVAALVYRSYRQKKAANRELSEKNHEIMAQREHIASQKGDLEVAFLEISRKNQRITQSINYAQRIQTAMMPSPEALAASLPSSFLLFQPRDIVSGDFYWLAETDGKLVVAVADCTGHGVPGALVSMVGMNLLSQIVAHDGVWQPAEVLAQLHQGIYNALGHGSNQTQDGMDIALAAIDRKGGQVFFAGAKNGLAYARKGEIHLLPADRKPIGGRQRDPDEVRTFAQQQIPLEKGMRLYLFSDGYQDQFGGAEGRKLMSRNFYALLQESASLPIGQQGERLRQAFQQWKGQQEQIDDVLVLGIEL